MDKAELRQNTLTQLANLTGSEREAAELNLMNQFETLIKQRGYRKIGFYYGKFPELTTTKFFEKFPEIDFYLPRIMPKRQLRFHLYKVGDSLEEVWGIPQPIESAPDLDVNELDLLIVPGVAFEPAGYRIGFGGGYYDRVLKFLNTPTVSLIFKEQWNQQRIWELNEFDLPVQQVIIDQRETISE